MKLVSSLGFKVPALTTMSMSTDLKMMSKKWLIAILVPGGIPAVIIWEIYQRMKKNGVDRNNVPEAGDERHDGEKQEDID